MKTTDKADRRSFLKLAGASVVGSSAAAVGATAPAAAEETAQAKPGALYRETDHIRRYYELARKF